MSEHVLPVFCDVLSLIQRSRVHRKKAKLQGQFKGMVRGVKKGALSGKRMQKNKRRAWGIYKHIWTTLKRSYLDWKTSSCCIILHGLKMWGKLHTGFTSATKIASYSTTEIATVFLSDKGFVLKVEMGGLPKMVLWDKCIYVLKIKHG